MKPLQLVGAPRLIQVVIVVDDPKEGIHLASKTTQRVGEFRVISRESDFAGIEPARTVFIRGFVSQGLYDATEFFRQMGAVILDINYKELKRDE